MTAAPVVATSFLGNPVAWTEGAGALILGGAGYGGEAPGPSGALKPLGLGSTGRTEALNLVEQMAMKDAMANPQLGRRLIEGMKDARWTNWTKMEYKVKTENGVNAVIHYMGQWDGETLKAIDDFKFK